jgi:hypothetical protein
VAKAKKSIKAPKRSADIAAPHVAVRGEPGVFVRIVDGAHIAPCELDVEVPVNENRPAEGVVSVRSSTRRVKSPLDLSLGRGVITAEQHAAGTRLYECFAFGVMGASGGPTKGHTAAKAVGGNGVSDARVQAITHYRKALGWVPDAIVRRVLESVVCHDNTVRVTAADLGLNPTLCMSYLRAGLDSLVDYFDLG